MHIQYIYSKETTISYWLNWDNNVYNMWHGVYIKHEITKLSKESIFRPKRLFHINLSNIYSTKPLTYNYAC